MLYFIHGNDNVRARAKASELVESLLKKKPDAGFFKITDEDFSADVINEYIGGQGLFSKKYIVVLDGICEVGGEKKGKSETGDTREEILISRLKELSESENIFIIREGELDKKTVAKIEKYSTKSQEYSEKDEKATTAGEFNVFALADAFANKNRESLWVGYIKALKAGVAVEQIQGMLFWQAKSMLLALSSRSADEAGLKPFVYSKSLKAGNAWGIESVRKAMENLVKIYHESRREAGNLEILLEKYILSLK